VFIRGLVPDFVRWLFLYYFVRKVTVSFIHAAAQAFLFRKLAFVGDGALLGSAGAATLLAAHFLDGLGFGGGFAVGDGIELVAELAAGEEAVHLAGALDLAFDGDAGWLVLEEDAVRGFVDLLAASSGATDEFLGEIGWINAKRSHAHFEGVGFFRGREVHRG
jgi:hypothetical protein